MDELRARLVLKDAHESTERLRARFASGDNWRIDWVATVALLRAVGHVLDKVDKEVSGVARNAIDGAWKRWKADRAAHAVFHDFIESERNLVLKQYELGTNAPSYLLTETGDRILLENGSGGLLLLGQPNLGPVEEALRWWEEQLLVIESEIARDGLLKVESPRGRP